MTKADLVEQVAEAIGPGITKKDCALVVDGFLNAVKLALAEGENIEIRGFGTFKVRSRKSRMARNPRSLTQRRISRTASRGREMSTDPTPTSRPGAWATNPATSSLEIRAPLGPTQALIRLIVTPAASIAPSVAVTGHSCAESAAADSDRVHLRSDSNMGCAMWRAVGC